MKKILVTGGAGFIGSHTCVELLSAGYDVVVADNFSNSRPEMLKGIEGITGKNVVVHNADCADFQSLESVFEKEVGIDAVIHFAAFKAVGESMVNPFKYYGNNIQATLNLLEVMKKKSVMNLVFSSSCTVYGQPFRLPVDESSPIGPALSPYGHTKQISEKMINTYHGIWPEMKSVVLRYFNPIGAHPSTKLGELPLGKPENLVPYMTQSAAGLREEFLVFGIDYKTPDGTCVRDYIHVVDVAKAHVNALSLLMKKDGDTKQVFNLGVGRGFSVLEVIKAFEKVSGKKLQWTFGPRRPGDVAEIWTSTKKANEVLGWKASYGLEEMLDHAWKWQVALGKE